jgi:transcription elongation factor Elf1
MVFSMRDRTGQNHVRTVLASIDGAAKQVSPGALYDAFQEIEAAEFRRRRIDGGQVLMRPEQVSVNRAGAQKYAAGLLDGLSRIMKEYNLELRNLKKRLRGNEAGTAADLILTNKAEDLAALARSCGVSLDVMSFFAVYFARPYRREAARRLTRGLDLSRWSMGFCPVCGHAPCFCRLAGRTGRRVLWCHACGTRWNFARLRCPFCLNDNHDKLKYFTVNDDETYRIDVCESCRQYLKTRRTTARVSDGSRESAEIELDYLLTTHLDYVAVKEGYARESVLGVHRGAAGGEEGFAQK